MHINRKARRKMTSRLLTVFLILLVLGISYGFSKVVTFPKLLKVENLKVKCDRIFVIEGPSVSIYSLDDYKLIKKFGRMGEGPQEFKISPPDYVLRIDVLPEHIVVNSVKKVSHFTLDGEFVKEKRLQNLYFFLRPLGENFIGESFITEDDVSYRAFHIYNPDFKQIKEVYRQKHTFQDGKGIFIGKEIPICQVVKDLIFISGKEGFVIDIYDKNGNLHHTFEKPYEKRKMTAEDEKMIHDLLKKEIKGMYERVKSMIKIAPEFPVIGNILFDDQHVYVTTNKEQEGKMEVFMFDIKGKFQKKIFLPVVKKDPFRPYPLDFYKGKLYQLIDNETTEEWELHVTDIPKK